MSISEINYEMICSNAADLVNYGLNGVNPIKASKYQKIILK